MVDSFILFVTFPVATQGLAKEKILSTHLSKKTNPKPDNHPKQQKTKPTTQCAITARLLLCRRKSGKMNALDLQPVSDVFCG
jgi:hypothetical protein